MIPFRDFHKKMLIFLLRGVHISFFLKQEIYLCHKLTFNPSSTMPLDPKA